MVGVTIVFLYGFVLDTFYVLWLKSVQAHRILLASFASVLVAAPGLLGFVQIVEDKKMAIPYLCGLFCGTMVAMIIFKDKDKDNDDVQNDK